MTDNDLTRIIIAAAIEVHRELGGPGLLETVYEEALVYELQLRGIATARQTVVPIIYKGVRLKTSLRLDLLVQGRIIVECKSMPMLPAVAKSQALTYLRVSKRRLALLINFGQPLLKSGITRVVNG